MRRCERTCLRAGALRARNGRGDARPRAHLALWRSLAMTASGHSRSTCPPSRRVPAARGTTPWPWPGALPPASDVDAHPWLARHGDDGSAGRRWPAARRAVRAARPGVATRAGWPSSRSASPRCSAGSRCRSTTARTTRCRRARPVPCVGDHSRLHVLRPPRVAPPLQGCVLPAGHPPRRAPRRGSDLRQPGDGRAARRPL